MTAVKKSLAMFLAVIMLFSSLSVGAFAVELGYYSVETYFMNTKGSYSSVPDSTDRYYGVIGSTVTVKADEYEGFALDTSKSDTEVVVNEDGTSVAKVYYQRNKYKFTYVYEDLLGPQKEVSVLYYGENLPSFEANPSGKPAKKGYNFIMWSTDPDERVEAPLTMPASDLELYPIYEIKTYTFTYDAVDGVFSNGESVLTQVYEYGEKTSEPEEPVKDNYVFVDWDEDRPEVAEKNMEFFALYNEITYFVAFFNGEEEIYYEDGYYFGDYFEEVDVPEGYEAWTLFDGTYVSFPYEIKGDTEFYAAPAPEEYTARFYLDINDDEPYLTFTTFSGDEIEFPEEPSRIGYKFVSWTSDISVMPDEDIDFIAEWEPIEYTITFDTDGGSEIAPKTYYYNNKTEAPAMPEKEGCVFVGWKPEIPETMPAENITVTAQWEKTVKDDYLGIRTEFYSYDETAKDWIATDKVQRGENVKVRFFLETGFAVSDGQLLFFFDEEFFSCNFNNVQSVKFNPSKTSTAGKYYINGTYHSPIKTVFNDLVEEEYITKEFLDNHIPVTMTFSFADYVFRKISGDEWFAEFELTVKDDAVGSGDFFVVPDTIISEERYYAYSDFTCGIEGGTSWKDDCYQLYDFTASINVESRPVSTGYGRVTVDANEGYFASCEDLVMTYDFASGETTSIIETPVRDGYIFAGFEPEIPEVMSGEVLSVKAQWIPRDDISYKIIAHYTDFSNGEAVEATAEYERKGKTDSIIKIVEEMPAYPDDNTVYILLSDFGFEYNVFDSDAENVIEGVILPDGSAVLEIYYKPATYNVVFNANGGKFNDGSTLKTVEATYGELAINLIPSTALTKNGFTFNSWIDLDETTRIDGEIVFYAKWDINVHTLTLIVDGTEYKEDYEFGSVIDSDVVPEKVGHKFVRWEDENGIEYAYLPAVMPDESLTLTAVFEKNQYTVTFDDGTNIDTKTYYYLDELDYIPFDPSREGYDFLGWYDENGTLLNDSEYIVTDNVIFTAKWELSTYFAYEIDENGNAIIIGLSDSVDEIVIPSTIKGHPVTGIKDGAFKSNSNITSVTIPESVTDIGDNAFADCDNLTSIVVDSENSDYSSDENGVLFNKDKTELIRYPAGRTDKEYEIPEGVEKIDSNAFEGSENLENITIPDSVSNVGEDVFRGCTELKEIYFSGDKSDWDNIFEDSGNDQIANVTIYFTEGYYTYTVDENGNATITDVSDAIGGEVTVPSELGGHPVTTIGWMAFADCDYITKVVIDGNITTIGGGAFVACDRLMSVVIGSSVTTIDGSAFSNCARLSSVEIGENVEEIGEYAFADNHSLTSIVIPDSVKTIGWNAFENCTGLKSVVIGEGVTKIDRYAFRYCDAIETVYIGSDIEFIGINAFYPCKELREALYNGTKEDWNSVTVKDGNGKLTLTLKYLKETETTTQPVVTEPTTAQPTTTKPVVTEPATVKPTTTKPVVTEHTTAKPTTTKPVVTEPTTAKPTTTKPVVTEPATVKPTTTKPVVTEPTTIVPSTTKPVVTEPTTVVPSTTKPVVTEPTTAKPTTTKPVETEPTTAKPTTTKPVVTEPITVVPSTTKPVVTEPTTAEPTTTKPVVTEPATKPAEPTTKPGGIVKVEIRKPSVTTIKYGDSIILHADIEGTLPQGAEIVWSMNNSNFKLLSTSVDGTTCTITPNSKGDTVITVSIVDKDGNELGSDTQIMTSKAGCIQKILAFFRKIFGLTKIYPEIFRSVF